MPKLASFLLLVSLLSTQAHGQTRDRFLVPADLRLDPIEGAHGSKWVSELRVLNTGPAPVRIDNLPVSCRITCELLLPAGASIPIRALQGQGEVNEAIQGWLIETEQGLGRELAFQLRVRDTSRTDSGWGTWFPVVSENEVGRGAVYLMNVPLETGYRQMLRVYSFDRNAWAARVSVFENGPSELLPWPTQGDRLLTKFTVPLTAGGFNQPAYAQTGDLTQLPELAGEKAVRLVVEPLGEFAIWGMVTVTNNATQEVTAILPNGPGI